MLYGQQLKKRIREMGLSVNKFAKLAKKPDGSSLSPPAITNIIIKGKGVDAEDDTIKAIDSVLRRRCKCCKQYLETGNDETATKEEDEGGISEG